MLRMDGFELHQATSPEEALALWSQHPESMYVAGGTDLLPNLKHRIFQPRHVIGIGRALPSGWEITDDAITIGAGTTLSALAGLVELPPLAQAADTARPLAAEPDPFLTPDETNILRAIAEETEDAGHRLKSWSEEQAAIAIRQCKFARDMEENGERMIALSTKLK